MESAQARKAATPTPSVRSASSAHTMASSQRASGAASGLPLFLQQRPADSSAEQAVQLWDCAEYAEPTCVQSQLDETLQAKCAACAEEDELNQAAADDSDVQLWDCAEYAEPTCVQSQIDDSAPVVQAKCAACEAEDEAKDQLQAKSTPDKRPSPQVIRREAAKGLQGASQALPHGAAIQAAFGHHDISAVRTRVGGTAAAASRRMGALAFTAGSRIGFRGTPGLHLAAHEAAHTVQQRAGLSLPNRVGQAGDRYERHADQVADAVVTGRSAEKLLDEVAAPDVPANEARQSAENEASTPAAPAVQQQITSGASRLFEPSPVREESPEPVTEGRAAAPETSPEATESSDGGEADALEAAGESEVSPEGTEGGVSAAGATATESTRGAGACYSAAAEERPEEAEEPSADNRGAESEAAPQVTFEPWPPEADDCPAAEAMAEEGSERLPEGMGADSAGALSAGVPSAEGVASSGGNAAATATGGAPSGSSEVPARSQTAGAEASTAETSAMDGQIAITEGGRDAAVGDYLASTGTLSSVLARSQALTSGVTFPAAASSQQAENRQAAIAQTRDFMARATHQIASAVTFAQQQVPVMLRAAAESVKGSIQGAIETEKSAISDRIAQGRAQARAGAATARAQVRADYASSAATLEAVTLEAISALDSTHTTSIEQVHEKETLGLDDVNARFADGRSQHEEKGPDYADRAIATGQRHVAGYEHCKGDYSDDGFWDGCLTVRRAKAQQDAACKTAAGYKDTFLRTANRKGYDLLPLRRQYRCAVMAGASQVNQTLDDTHAQLVSGLESGRMQALDGMAMARDESLAAIGHALTATLEAFTAQEFSQRQAVNDAGYLKQLAVEQLAHTGAAGLARGISAAMDSLEQTLRRLRDRLAQGDIPDPAELRRSLAVTEAALGDGVGTLLDTMMAGALGSESQIAAMGAAALAELAQLTSQNDERSAQAESGFTQQMDSLKRGAADTFGQLTDNSVEQAQQAMTDGTASLEQAVAGFDEALATIGGNVDEAIATSLEALDQELNTKLGELDGQIIREAWKAAEKEQPAWKSVVAIILVIVVIIAAAIISIVTLGAGASLFAVILVGALVGAVSGGLIQLINNWASGEAWHQGLAQAMIMGAIGGAIGGGLGFAGGALASGAATAGARAVTQLGITLTADIVSEAATQTVGYVAFGQQFNWQGFVMAGVMSGVSFRAHPGGARAGRPHVDVPTPSAAGAAAGRRAAVAQVAGGAAVGLGVEAATAAISGEKFDLTRAASAAASGAVGARMARRGGSSGSLPEATTPRTSRPAAGPELPTRPSLSSRLEDVGGRLFGSRAAVDQPTGPRIEESSALRPPATEESAPTTRPLADESDVSPRRPPTDDPDAETGRRPSNLGTDTLAELTGPANRMNDTDLTDATTTRARVGDAEHDFRITRDGPEVCSSCGPTIQRLTQMIDALPPGPLRRRLERLRVGVGAVETRLASGESGVNMVRDSARIAADFRALGEIHPSLGRSLQDPQLRQTTTHGSDGAVMTSPHLHDLDADIVRTERLDIDNFRSSSLARGESAIYILRDSSSGAVLKVGIAESGRGRFGAYRTAGNNLDLRLQLDIAVVTPRRGRTIRDIEAQLRTRLESEGHILPWDNDPITRRLGRGGQGTPFVYQSGFLWTRDGRRISLPEAVASLRRQGRTDDEIVRHLSVETISTESNIRRWITTFSTEIQAAERALNSGDG